MKIKVLLSSLLVLALMLTGVAASVMSIADAAAQAADNSADDKSMTLENNNKEEINAELATGEYITADNSSIKMPKIFADGMVLQRQKDLNVFGYCDVVGATVKVTVTDKDGNEAEATATVSAEGEWRATLPAMEAQTGVTIVVEQLGLTNPSYLTFRDVSIGEVFVVSGQSNASFQLYMSEDYEEYVSNADNFNIKIYAEKSSFATVESKLGNGVWVDATAANLAKGSSISGNVSAYGYVTVARMAMQLGDDVPVALINVTKSASRIITWMDYETIDEVIANGDKLSATTLKTITTNKATGDGRREYYAENGSNPASGHSLYVQKPYVEIPNTCYNAMIHPLRGYSVRAIMWYQGCGDASKGYDYEVLYEAFEKNWREVFGGDENLPFFITQLAPTARDGGYSEMGAVMYDIAKHLNDSYVVSTGIDGSPWGASDLVNGGAPDFVHPSRKSTLGMRTANTILKELFGIESEHTEASTAPDVVSYDVNGTTLTLTFDSKIKLLRAVMAEGFELLNSSGKWIPVLGEISDNKITFNTDFEICGVRYGFKTLVIELNTGELIPYLESCGSDDNTKVTYKCPDGRVLVVYPEDGQVIRTMVDGNITNDSGEPLYTFSITFE